MDSSVENEIRNQLAQSWEINAPGNSFTEFEAQLAARINQLVNEDFNKLISILYRLDIDEHALRKFLQDTNANDAGTVIAGMVIQRQLQKNKSRQEFRQRDDNIDEAEKW